MRKPTPTTVMTGTDYCHGNLVLVQSLVNRTVDVLAVNVGRPIDAQVAPPVVPQGVPPILPAQKALTVGQLHRQITGTSVPTTVSFTMAGSTAVVTPMLAAKSEQVWHTKLDPAYPPFIDNNKRRFSITGYHLN